MENQKIREIEEEEKISSDPGMQSARVPVECTGVRSDSSHLLSIYYMSDVVLSVLQDPFSPHPSRDTGVAVHICAG